MNQADLIVARIERARQDRGISVAELARRINVDRKRLWYVLNGQRSVDSAWFEDPGSGKEYLLFRISDVEEVCRSFDELSKEAGEACDRAAAGLAKLRAREAATGRDERPLAERAENARKASKALEAESATTRAATRGPRMQEVRAR